MGGNCSLSQQDNPHFPISPQSGWWGLEGESYSCCHRFPMWFHIVYPSSSRRHLRGGLSHHHTPPSHTVHTVQYLPALPPRPDEKTESINDSRAITDPEHGNRTRHRSDDPSLTFPSIGIQNVGRFLDTVHACNLTTCPPAAGDRLVIPTIPIDDTEQEMDEVRPINQPTNQSRRRLMSLFLFCQRSIF